VEGLIDRKKKYKILGKAMAMEISLFTSMGHKEMA
jgi:hypothetical protein